MLSLIFEHIFSNYAQEARGMITLYRKVSAKAIAQTYNDLKL